MPRTCTKTLLVEASLVSNPGKIKQIYVAIDQSNVSFIDNELVEFWGVEFTAQLRYIHQRFSCVWIEA